MNIEIRYAFIVSKEPILKLPFKSQYGFFYTILKNHTELSLDIPSPRMQYGFKYLINKHFYQKINHTQKPY
jgi:hypothetical protein